MRRHNEAVLECPERGLLVSVFSLPSQEQTEVHGLRTIFFIVQLDRAGLIQLGNLRHIGQLRPIIETFYPLSGARQAFERALSGHTRGKIILQMVD